MYMKISTKPQFHPTIKEQHVHKCIFKVRVCVELRTLHSLHIVLKEN